MSALEPVDISATRVAVNLMLEDLRELVQEVVHNKQAGVSSSFRTLEQFARVFDALDTRISEKGVLPEDWEPTSEYINTGGNS